DDFLRIGLLFGAELDLARSEGSRTAARIDGNDGKTTFEPGICKGFQARAAIPGLDQNCRRWRRRLEATRKVETDCELHSIAHLQIVGPVAPVVRAPLPC